jgi:hypothetical protein
VDEKKEKQDALAGTLSRELGSPESRAAARRILQDPQRMPVIISQYVKTVARDENDCPTAIAVCDSQTAAVAPCNGEETIFVREEGETLEAFERRCCNSLPVRTGGVIRMKGDAHEDYVRAEWGGQNFLREPNETLEQFRDRVHASLPGDGHPGLILWYEK